MIVKNIYLNYLSIFTIAIFSMLSCTKKDKNVHFIDISKYRYIAHAGGSIDSLAYSNSLEAMDSNYEKGARIFELDIIETSDGKLVAAHDWQKFKEITNYTGSQKGKEALTEAEFLNSKIYGKYTPLNMERINEWFSNHPDTYLISDKINDPAKLIDKKEGFKFKNRLLMELFSWQAIDTANKLGITSIASEILIFNFQKKNKIFQIIKRSQTINNLKEKNIKYVCYHIKNIPNNENFVKQLKNEGFQSYIYGLNKVKNEKYVKENYFQLVQGMYADNLDSIK